MTKHPIGAFLRAASDTTTQANSQTVLLLIGLGSGAVSALVAGLLAWWRGRGGDKASTTDLITQAAGRVLAQVQARADAMDEEMKTMREARQRLEREVDALSRAVHSLAQLVRDHGGNPDPVMDRLDLSRDPNARTRATDKENPHAS